MLSWTHAELPEPQFARRSRGPQPHWMEMKNRLLFVPVLVALVVSLAACGGGSQQIPAGAIAVVNGTPITTAQYNDFFQQGITAAKLQGQTVTPGSTGYTAVLNQTVAELVELAEVKQQ